MLSSSRYDPPRILYENPISDSLTYIGSHGGKFKVFSEEEYEDEEKANSAAISLHNSLRKCKSFYNVKGGNCRSCNCREVDTINRHSRVVMNRVICKCNQCVNF